MKIILILATLFLTTTVIAQRVNDAVFCTDVIELECIGAIASGQTIALGELKKVDGVAIIHYWGSLLNPGDRVAVFYFIREGECYKDKTIDPNSPALDKVSVPREFLSFFQSLTFGDLLSYIGLQELGAGKGDMKLNFVFADRPSETFRVHDYRLVHCPGTIAARILDSNGVPIPGNNDLRIVVTD